jgi:hypothetical protein
MEFSTHIYGILNLIMTSTIFWNVMPYSLVEVYRHFTEMYCLHLHGQRIN